jgi:YtkA-like
VLTVIGLAGGCHRRQASAISVETKFAPDPARVGREAVTVTLRDKDARAMTGAQIAVEGNMSHPGMAPVFGDARETEPGRYEASLDLSMRGSWVVLLHVRLADGEKIERQIAVDVKAD